MPLEIRLPNASTLAPRLPWSLPSWNSSWRHAMRSGLFRSIPGSRRESRVSVRKTQYAKSRPRRPWPSPGRRPPKCQPAGPIATVIEEAVVTPGAGSCRRTHARRHERWLSVTDLEAGSSVAFSTIPSLAWRTGSRALGCVPQGDSPTHSGPRLRIRCGNGPDPVRRGAPPHPAYQDATETRMRPRVNVMRARRPRRANAALPRSSVI